MRSGDGILVHTKEGFLPKKVQKFQSRLDPISGKWNHSMRVYIQPSGKVLVLEAAKKDYDENKGKLRKAAMVFNPLSNYTDYPDKYELLLLQPKIPYDRGKIEDIMMKWEGTPYELHNLLGDQIIQYLFGWWWGRSKKIAHKYLICHEGFMKVDNDYFGDQMFPNWHLGMVKDVYEEKFYNHGKLQ